jgi:hypothetical protein
MSQLDAYRAPALTEQDRPAQTRSGNPPALGGVRCTRAEPMIRKLKGGEYRLYSRKPDPKTGKRRNLGTFQTLEAAKRHEREVQYFKRQR